MLTGPLARLARAGTRKEFNSPGFTRTPLPGACLQPETETEKILAAVVDTVIPGADLDPDQAPGGMDSCALNLLFDDYYPFRAQAGVLASLMNLVSQGEYSKNFLEITYEQRIQVLLKAEEEMPILRLAYRAIRSAFYGGAYNGVGLEYLKYPGPNLGYRHIPQASFRKPVCKEMTETGWMP